MCWMRSSQPWLLPASVSETWEKSRIVMQWPDMEIKETIFANLIKKSASLRVPPY